MNKAEYFSALTLSMVCLVLSFVIVYTSRSNNRLYNQLQLQQEEIERGNTSRQIGASIVNEMARVSSNSGSMRSLLQKYGIQPPPPAAGPGVKDNASPASPRPGRGPSEVPGKGKEGKKK